MVTAVSTQHLTTSRPANRRRLLLRPTETISTHSAVALVWIMAALGITYQIIYHERHKWLETCFYVIVGVFPAIVIIDMVG